MKFWEYAAVHIACAMVRNAGATGIRLEPSAVIARFAADVADKLEEERIKRTAGSKPS